MKRKAEDLTPAEIVAELDRFIVGQRNAKRAVAIALRNRWRRKQLPPELRDEVAPKNIIMIGPTGVGKTEIARRLAKLTSSPFVKVEASKFTEVGYVGRDVESIIRDLVDAAIQLVRAEKAETIKVRAARAAEHRLVDLLLVSMAPQPSPDAADVKTSIRKQLREGLLEDVEVELEVDDQKMPFVEVFTPQGIESMGINFHEMFSGLFSRRKRRRMKVSEARKILIAEEEDKLIDRSQVESEALSRVEESGIVFLDEIDKVASSQGTTTGPDISREGVQRDLLPIVEGTTVNTRYGQVKTDHILFIAAGAFHVSKPSDLIPELQGRFPIRVELSPLGKEDFKRILTEPENSLVKQYTALLATEDVKLVFEEEAIEAIADYAARINSVAEDIGARRLHTVMEHLLEDILFEAPSITGQEVVVTPKMVEEKLEPLAKDEDLARYIL